MSSEFTMPECLRGYCTQSVYHFHPGLFETTSRTVNLRCASCARAFMLGSAWAAQRLPSYASYLPPAHIGSPLGNFPLLLALVKEAHALMLISQLL